MVMMMIYSLWSNACHCCHGKDIFHRYRGGGENKQINKEN